MLEKLNDLQKKRYEEKYGLSKKYKLHDILFTIPENMELEDEKEDVFLHGDDYVLVTESSKLLYSMIFITGLIKINLGMECNYYQGLCQPEGIQEFINLLFKYFSEEDVLCLFNMHKKRWWLTHRLFTSEQITESVVCNLYNSPLDLKYTYLFDSFDLPDPDTFKEKIHKINSDPNVAIVSAGNNKLNSYDMKDKR